MQQREKLLLAVTIGVVLIWAGMPTLRRIYVTPISEARAELSGVDDQLADQTEDIKRLKLSGITLKQQRGRSLPPKPLDAQRLYQVWLDDLAGMSGIESPAITPGRRVVSRRRSVRGELFTGVLVSVEGKANLETLSRFLFHFYRYNIAHRIVSLNIESPETRGDPQLTFSLTAEGLSFPTATKRSTIFPQTTLKREFRSSSKGQVIEVVSAADFPKKPGYRIRIGNELLTVTSAAGKKLTVTGGVDTTKASRHSRGDIVILAPIHPAYASRKPADYEKLAASSPFVKPQPPKRTTRPAPTPKPPSRPRDPKPIARTDRAAETRLRGAIVGGDQPQAWLYGKSIDDRLVVEEGSQLELGDFQAVVRQILADHVLLEYEGFLWRLDLGESLRSMTKLTAVRIDPATDKPDEEAPVIAPVPGVDS